MQGVAFFFALGIGIATAALLYLFSEQERQLEQPYESSDYRHRRANDNANSQNYGPRSSESSFSRRQNGQSGSIQQCVICLENMLPASSVQKLRCGHKFHKECIENWLQVKRECPHCRREAI